MCVFNTRVMRVFNTRVMRLQCACDVRLQYACLFNRHYVSRCQSLHTCGLISHSLLLCSVSASPRRSYLPGHFRTGSCVPSVSCPGSDSNAHSDQKNISYVWLQNGNFSSLTALRAGPPFSWGVTSGGPPGGRSLSKDGTDSAKDFSV